MPKDSDEKIAILALIAFAAGLFVGLPILYLPSQDHGEGSMIWGTVPQWLTALIAGGALIAAAVSISSQREIARKRAATDFFLKTEMDRDTLASHKKFVEASTKLKSLMAEARPFEEFIGTGDYYAMRDYLNLHELIAVGINNEVFDDVVCYDFWSGELKRAYEDTGRFASYSDSLTISIRKPLKSTTAVLVV
jgi:Domain of unknown function (DUF4760)